METKDCSRCGKRISLEGFGVNSASEDGFQAYCKECLREYRKERRNALKVGKPQDWKKKTADKASYMRAYRADHPEYYREKEKRKYERKMKRLKGDEYVVGAKENRKGNENLQRYMAGLVLLSKEEKRKRNNAKKNVYEAVLSGRIIKTNCFVCGEVDVQAHHADYDQPFDVIWLCDYHHREIHATCG